MWFDGMGCLLAGEHIEAAKKEITLAIESSERDLMYYPEARQRMDKLRRALALLSGEVV